MAAEVNVTTHKISGRSSAVSACGIFTKRITLADLSAGTLVSCILVRGEGKDLSDVMRGIFEIAEKKLEGGEGGLLAILEETTLPAKNYAPDVEVDLVHAFFYADVCYFVRIGQTVKVLLFEPPKSGEIDFESGSGQTRAGQLYLIATDSFFSIFDTSPLSQEAEVDLEEVIDGIATEIAGEENQSEIGAAFVAITEVSEVTKVSQVLEEGEQKGETESQREIETKDKRELISDKSEREGVENREDIHDMGDIEDSQESVEVDSRQRLREEPRPRRILSSVFAELAKIRRGDIGAVRRNIVAIAIIVVLVLVLSVGFTIYKKGESAKLANFSQHIEIASAKYSEAVAILELNRSRAREILIEADREVKLALEIKSDDSEAKKLAADIEQKLKETESSETAALSEVVDLADSVVSLSISGNNLAAISEDKVYTVNLVTKDKTDVSSEEGISRGIVFDNRAFLISGQKIFRIDLSDEKRVDVGTGSGGLDIGVFAGNVYVLLEDSITKFVPTLAGYSDGSEYLSSPETFGSRSHFAIDGSLWVSSGREILKFTRGDRESFEISGLVGGAGEFSLIYTTPDLDNLYVVDSTNSALLVISKEGVYKGVVQSPEFARASDLVVDELEEKVYISSGSKVLAASL